ncbi:MAG: leucyl/phenylalanyl-tRNA--protein transferase [Candidatus Puniceispirillaceae bacterium]
MADQHIYSPETIIKAYSLGLFPMADSHDSLDIKFYNPDQRALIPLDSTLGRGVHIPRRLQRRVRQAPYAVTINKDFTAVIDACAARSERREDTWINADIRRLYIALHKMGFAHSVEVWLDEALVGGLYGVALRAAFFGESMFTRKSDASKIALVHLMARLRHGRFLLLDAQFTNDHLQQFGITDIDREDFQDRLADALLTEADLALEIPSAKLVIPFLSSLTDQAS